MGRKLKDCDRIRRRRGLAYQTLREWVQTRDRTGCWLWPFKTNYNGYGIVWDGSTKLRTTAHRIAYILDHGSIEHQACHRCDNPPCCNPDHVFDGTQKENLADMKRKGRAPKGLHTPHGEENRWAKLTESQVRAIRADARPSSLVAHDFGIDRGCVWQVRTRKSWRHVA